jgi:hypothetical protein
MLVSNKSEAIDELRIVSQTFLENSEHFLALI